jgi:Flp pilus assembly protein TadD
VRRFVSAETTYGDVVKLYPGDSKASFFLALSQLAQGRTGAALAQLASMDSGVDDADLGLAYALAGQNGRALALLEPAARSPMANGRVRQNLALAYALAGDWKRAHIVAEQDLSPTDLNKRLQQWAALASTAAPETRVAMMLGVSPVSDPGQPARLALAPAAPAVQAARRPSNRRP